MPVGELILKGLELMLLGMGIVFVFLLLLVAAMFSVAKLVNSISNEVSIDQQLGAGISPSGTQSAMPADLYAVISAAISHYRRSHT